MLFKVTFLTLSFFCSFLILFSLQAYSLPPAPDGVRIEQDVTYLDPDRKEKCDLYLPIGHSDQKQPAVVIIHGGGWRAGARNSPREFNIGTTLALNGYVGMSIDYDLASATHASWPQNLYDCKTAVRWLRKHADQYHIDPDHIGIIGGSAGGHLAAMVTLTTPADGLDPKDPYHEFSCQVNCGIDMYGITLVAGWDPHSQMIGSSSSQVPELYRAASPITYARTTSRPLLIIHGTADTTVKIEQSMLLADKLKAAGADYQFITVPGAPHSFDLQPPQMDLRPIVLGFFNKYLKPSDAISSNANAASP